MGTLWAVTNHTLNYNKILYLGGGVGVLWTVTNHTLNYNNILYLRDGCVMDSNKSHTKLQ